MLSSVSSAPHPSPLLVSTFNSPENPRILAQRRTTCDAESLCVYSFFSIPSITEKVFATAFSVDLFWLPRINPSPNVRVRPDLKRKEKNTSRPVIIGSRSWQENARASVPIQASSHSSPCYTKLRVCIQNKSLEQHSKKYAPTHRIAIMILKIE